MLTASGKNSVGGYLRLFRPGNCVMGAFGALLAVIVCVGLDGLSDYAYEIAFSLLVVVSFTAASNSYNDYSDRETDKVAHPERPIPTGTVTPQGAALVAALLFGVAVVLSYFVNLWSLTIVVTSVLVMVGYEKALKAEGLAGNLAIGWLTGALFLFGGAAVDRLDLAWILAALAFLATLGREIVKDIQDIEGDRGARRTLPMRIGSKNASIFGALAFVAAVILSPFPYLLELLSTWYIPAVLAADAIFIYCALIQFQNPEKGQKVAKLAMLVALIAFLVGGVL